MALRAASGPALVLAERLSAPGPMFRAAVVVGIIADLEGLCASLLLSRWHHDVPTAWHALVIERARGRPDRGATQ